LPVLFGIATPPRFSPTFSKQCIRDGKRSRRPSTSCVSPSRYSTKRSDPVRDGPCARAKLLVSRVEVCHEYLGKLLATVRSPPGQILQGVVQQDRLNPSRWGGWRFGKARLGQRPLFVSVSAPDARACAQHSRQVVRCRAGAVTTRRSVTVPALRSGMKR